MSNFNKLSFDNMKVDHSFSDLFGERLNITVLSDEGECLAEAICKICTVKDFAYDCFYLELLEPEINYFFSDVFGDKERTKTENMPLDEYVKYINVKYGEDEASTLNELYKTYTSLNKYNSDNLLARNHKCVSIKSINSSYDKTGAGTLIVDYLKENYELIFLYGTMEAEGYWLDKVNFKEILNGFMYWTENEKLNEIL